MIGVLDGYLIDSSYETKAVFIESCYDARFRDQIVLDGYLIGVLALPGRKRQTE